MLSAASSAARMARRCCAPSRRAGRVPMSLERSWTISRCDGLAWASVRECHPRPEQDRHEFDNCGTRGPTAMLAAMAHPPIERPEVVALLFNVSDIAVTLTNIVRLLGEDDGEEETDED